jgi:hypothetical protein
LTNMGRGWCKECNLARGTRPGEGRTKFGAFLHNKTSNKGVTLLKTFA